MYRKFWKNRSAVPMPTMDSFLLFLLLMILVVILAQQALDE